MKKAQLDNIIGSAAQSLAEESTGPLDEYVILERARLLHSDWMDLAPESFDVALLGQILEVPTSAMLASMDAILDPNDPEDQRIREDNVKGAQALKDEVIKRAVEIAADEACCPDGHITLDQLSTAMALACEQRCTTHDPNKVMAQLEQLVRDWMSRLRKQVGGAHVRHFSRKDVEEAFAIPTPSMTLGFEKALSLGRTPEDKLRAAWDEVMVFAGEVRTAALEVFNG